MKLDARYLMIPAALLLAVWGIAFASCDSGINHRPPPNSIGGGNGEVSPEVKTFRDDAVALQMRPEMDVDQVTVQYILVGYGLVGAGPDKPSYTLPEAEEKAAEIYAGAKSVEDWDKLVLTESYGRMVQGQRPGMFTLLRGLGPEAKLTFGPTTFRREQEEPALARAAWRLKPGEVGPVERHVKDANTGYYVVRRLTEEELKRDNPANFDAPSDSIRTMRDAASELMARADKPVEKVRVQHILIARYMSDKDGTKKRLSPTEAEALAAEVFAKAKADPDSFSELVKEYTYDTTEGDPPGSYLMESVRDITNPTQIYREGMIPWFGDGAWRLEVGEIGVVLYDRANCYYGYHILKRVPVE